MCFWGAPCQRERKNKNVIAAVVASQPGWVWLRLPGPRWAASALTGGGSTPGPVSSELNSTVGGMRRQKTQGPEPLVRCHALHRLSGALEGL